MRRFEGVRVLKIHRTVNHNSYGATEYQIRAGEASLTLTNRERGRGHYILDATFTGEVTLELECTYAGSENATLSPCPFPTMHGRNFVEARRFSEPLVPLLISFDPLFASLLATQSEIGAANVTTELPVDL